MNAAAAMGRCAPRVQNLVAKNYFERATELTRTEAGHIIAVGWRECGMALKAAYGDKVGSELWGITHIDDRRVMMRRRNGRPSHRTRGLGT